MKSSPDANLFWAFSIKHYAKPAVSRICLLFQDQCHLNVNLLLYSLWLATCGRAFQPDLVSQNEALRQCSEDVLIPLRSARYAMKKNGMSDDQPGLYATLKQSELDLERVAQKLLLELTSGMLESDQPVRELANQNLVDYLKSKSVAPEQWRSELEQLLDEVLGKKD